MRQVPLAAVLEAIDRHVDGRSFLVLGDPGVDVFALNLELDASGR